MLQTIPRILLTSLALSTSLVTAGQENADPPSQADSFEVRLHDGKTLKLMWKDKQVTLVTPQGQTVSIPTADIWRIDFALGKRLTNDLRKRMEAAINDLGRNEFRRREAAAAELRRMGKQAYTALLEATASKDAEVAYRAKGMISRMTDETFDDEILRDLVKYDVVQTADKNIAGRITATSLKAQAQEKGDFRLNLAELESLQSLRIESEALAKAEPDPGQLMAYRNQVGKIFVFKVTGAIGGTVWGTKFYTDDSSLATAAVHAGVVKPGRTKKVRVKILGPMQAYQGTMQNGVFTNNFGPFGGTYQFLR